MLMKDKVSDDTPIEEIENTSDSQCDNDLKKEKKESN